MRRVLASLLAASMLSSARDLYVDPEHGNDAADGLEQTPLRTMARAIRLAQPGDTIDLVPGPTPYTELPTFHDKCGEPGRPIVLDGHGAILSGSEPLDPADWQLVEPGLYRCDKLLETNADIVHRYFFLFDGRMNRMGRSLKGPKVPFKAPRELLAQEWTWVEEEKAFYIRTPDGRKLADCRIEAPLRSNGVAVSGHCEHLVIRNLTTTHVYNDGFNIHGTARHVRFENVKAIECGDDGISAHDDCQIEVDGLLSTGNSTGVCHTGKSQSVSDHMTIRGNHGYDFFVLEAGTHVLRNSIIVCDAAQSVVVFGQDKTESICTLRLENVLIQRRGTPTFFKAHKGSVVDVARTVIIGLSMSIAGEAFTLSDSVIAGQTKPEIVVYPHTRWQADGNIYDAKYLRIGDTYYSAKTFDAYQRSTGQDAASTWTEVKFVQPAGGRVHVDGLSDAGIGVDPSRLPSLGTSGGNEKQ